MCKAFPPRVGRSLENRCLVCFGCQNLVEGLILIFRGRAKWIGEERERCWSIWEGSKGGTYQKSEGNKMPQLEKKKKKTCLFYHILLNCRIIKKVRNQTALGVIFTWNLRKHIKYPKSLGNSEFWSKNFSRISEISRLYIPIKMGKFCDSVLSLRLFNNKSCNRYLYMVFSELLSCARL